METALVNSRIQNDILVALNSAKGIYSLSTAFDTISHEILVSRLQTGCGIQSLHYVQWFRSYLMAQYQVTYDRGEAFDNVYLIYRVPQGSMLGPLEFISYMSPIYNIA